MKLKQGHCLLTIQGWLDKTSLMLNRTLHYIAGYLAGVSIFLVLIPGLVYYLSIIDSLAGLLRDLIPFHIHVVIAVVTGISGILLMIWSNITLFTIGKGGPAEGYGIEISPRTQVLVTSGPYAYCRNPMVLGALCLYLTIAVYQASLLGVAALLLFYIFISVKVISNEELRLERDFGEQYRQYKCSVPRMFPDFRKKFNNKRNHGLPV